MIHRVYERTAAHYEHLCVATDDDRIREAVEAFGGRAVMTSPLHQSGTDRAAEALDIYSADSGIVFDVVVNVQGDEPFVSTEHLTKIRALFDDPSTEIGTLVKKFSPSEDIFNPNTPKVVLSSRGEALYFSRSVVPFLRGVEQRQWQQAHVYYKHIGLYAYRSEILREVTALGRGKLEKAESLEQLRWLENGYRIRVAETVSETIAIDTPEDLERLLASMPAERFL